MSRRQRSPRADTGVHPTYTRILDAATAELTEYGFDRFNVQRVLEAAEVSRGTLYHHFPDVETLIEAALVGTFAQELLVSRESIRELIDRSHDRDTFREALNQMLRRRFSMAPAIVRLRRTHTIALSATRPTLAAAIAEVQDALTDAWTETVEEAQRRGFARPDLDARACAVMIQGMSLGRIVDDAASDQVGDERWVAAYCDFIDRTMIPTD